MTEQQFQMFLQRLPEVIALNLSQELAKAAPVDTGMLKNSIDYKVDGNSINIYMAKHGLYVEFGTAPRIIKPKNAKAIPFEDGELKTHPGTRPNPFIRTTVRTKMADIIKKSVAVLI